MKANSSVVLSLVVALGSACGSSVEAPATSAAPLDVEAGISRVVDKRAFTTLYAVSDVHGHLAELLALLDVAGLARGRDAASLVWTGGDATFVVTGDMIDKGPASLEVVEALMALQASAAARGGQVVVLLGNHEAEFFAGPTGSKFVGPLGVDTELEEASPPIAPETFAEGKDPRSAWLLARPLAARIGRWFFSHAGNAQGESLLALDADLKRALAGSSGWGDATITGSTSLLEARAWYDADGVVAKNLAALAVEHIVFGHDPEAFGDKGRIFASPQFGGALVKIDTGLGKGYSAGALLRVRHEGKSEVADAILPDGTTTPLFTSPARPPACH